MVKKFVRSWYGIKYDGTRYPINVLNSIYKNLKYARTHLREANGPIKEIWINNMKTKSGKQFFKVRAYTIEKYGKEFGKIMKEVAMIHSQWEQRYKREKKIKNFNIF